MVVRHLTFKIFLLFFMVVASLASGNAAPPTTPPTVPETCDGEFYNVMSNRAWMEANRELEVAQIIIRKPDSVLEYSCFELTLNYLGAGADSLFSDNIEDNYPERENDNSRKPPNFVHAERLDNVLGLVVAAPMFKFLGKNFGHTYGGGTISNIPSSRGRRICDAMDKVWQSMKCQNFNKSDFLDFKRLAYYDPRGLPLSCKTPEDRSQNWGDAIKRVNVEPADPPNPGGVTKVTTYLELFDGKKCSPTLVKTGITAKLGNKQVEDAVCVSPGCYSDGGGCK